MLRFFPLIPPPRVFCWQGESRVRERGYPLLDHIAHSYAVLSRDRFQFPVNIFGEHNYQSHFLCLFRHAVILTHVKHKWHLHDVYDIISQHTFDPVRSDQVAGIHTGFFT